jgi:hypothetical protein
MDMKLVLRAGHPEEHRDVIQPVATLCAASLQAVRDLDRRVVHLRRATPPADPGPVW